LSAPAVKQAHDPSLRFAAVAVVWIVRASVAPSPGEVTLAMGLGAKIGVLIGVGHGGGVYLICAASAPLFRKLPTGGSLEHATSHGQGTFRTPPESQRKGGRFSQGKERTLPS
jgi:hypothetical protein